MYYFFYILSFLNKMNINRLLIEGGSTLSSSFLDKNIVNLVYWFSSQNDLNSGKSLNKYDKKLNNLRDSQNFLLKDSINFVGVNMKKSDIFKALSQYMVLTCLHVPIPAPLLHIYQLIYCIFFQNYGNMYGSYICC